MSNKIVKEVPVIGSWEGYYNYTFHCPNCGKLNPRSVRKGHRIKDVAIECSYCECTIGEKIDPGPTNNTFNHCIVK